jgi:hypothetical protein
MLKMDTDSVRSKQLDGINENTNFRSLAFTNISRGTSFYIFGVILLFLWVILMCYLSDHLWICRRIRSSNRKRRLVDSFSENNWDIEKASSVYDQSMTADALLPKDDSERISKSDQKSNTLSGTDTSSCSSSDHRLSVDIPNTNEHSKIMYKF